MYNFYPPTNNSPSVSVLTTASILYNLTIGTTLEVLQGTNAGARDLFDFLAFLSFTPPKQHIEIEKIVSSPEGHTMYTQCVDAFFFF